MHLCVETPLLRDLQLFLRSNFAQHASSLDHLIVSKLANVSYVVDCVDLVRVPVSIRKRISSNSGDKVQPNPDVE